MQSKLVELRLDDGADADHVRIEYRAGRRRHRLGRAIALPQRRDWGPLVNALFPLAGVVLGAVVGAFITGRQAKLEWRRKLFEQSHAAYRKFLDEWGEAGNATLLASKFQTLVGQAHVPYRIRKQYAATHAELRESSDDRAKGTACTALASMIHDYEARPESWRYRR